MKKIIDTLRTQKYAIIWTLCYTAMMWSILYFLFNFDMFNSAQWHHLLNAELRGFPGFVFGILILSALPLYIATTTLVIRNKKPLISIPIPKLPALKKTPYTPPVLTKDAPITPPCSEQETTHTPLSSDIPPELRAAFIRARQILDSQTTSPTSLTPDTVVESTHTNTPTTDTPKDDAPGSMDTSQENFPLPFDFDLDTNNDISTTDFIPMSVPSFKEISFDDEPPTPQDTEQPQKTSETATVFSDPTQLIEHLVKTQQTFNQEDDIILTETHAIITHSDPDFWVADKENWFAAGKIQPSPISRIEKIAQQNKKTPAIYLASDNILDLDSLKQTWESAGIAVITNPADL